MSDIETKIINLEKIIWENYRSHYVKEKCELDFLSNECTEIDATLRSIQSTEEEKKKASERLTQIETTINDKINKYGSSEEIKIDAPEINNTNEDIANMMDVLNDNQ